MLMTAGFLREPLEVGRRAIHQWSEELGLPAGNCEVPFTFPRWQLQIYAEMYGG